MMKKKVVIATTVLSIALAGVVSAASIWGTYKGNDIIRLTVGGNPINVSDVPAISYNNRTMIPIYLLKQAGIDYTWDQANKTVNIVKSTPQQTVQTQTITKQVGVDYLKAYGNLVSYGVTGISSQAGSNNGNVIDYVVVNYNGLASNLPDTVFTKIATELTNAASTYLFIVFTDGSDYAIKLSDLKLWMSGQIDSSEMNKRIAFYPAPTPSNTSYNNITTTQTVDPAVCQKIRDDANRKGGTYSGGLEYQLQLAGCTP